MAKGMKGYENQKDGGYTAPKCAAEGKTVIKHGGRGEMADGKVSSGEKYPKGSTNKGNGKNF